MTTIKSYTDLPQSKKLAEFLPLDTADHCFLNDGTAIKAEINSYAVAMKLWKEHYIEIIPCWSLAALLGVLPSATLDSSNAHYYRLHCMERFTEWHNNPVDACVEMIIRFYELNLL